ncbi:zinc ABC transporter solute-binding protein [Rhodobacter sp. CCP-1]|uniref:Zinc ABC transporter solute-binding protein n=1 Tax=Paragemmobacter ruber TaxID=1985673 RepID=A0ABW9Y1A5_9RHOB|nr:zinc ABC transporter solute-binding protein [Rhodobacter ruber]
MDRRSLLASLALAPLLGSRALAAGATPAITATTGMIADIARRLTGGEVTALMGPGMDPHGYRPTRSDILALSRADIILWHGLNLEAQFADVMADLSRQRTVVALADSVPQADLLADPAYGDRPDPHVWFDPRLWSVVVDRAATVLAEAGVATEAPAQALRDEIAALDTYARQVLGSVPESARILVTAHDAFAYFGRAYGWQVEGIQGISTESEAGLARITELVDLLTNRQIPAVFVESSVSDRAIRALIEGAAARGHTVAVGGELFSDAMGPDDTYEGTYIGMMDHNVTTIARALGGTAPERGMSGRLNAGT